jgi:hypothetical protein
MYNPQPGYGPPQPYGQPTPYGPPPQRAPFVIPGQIVAIAFGVVALAGLLCTLLPMWTLDVNPADFERGRYGSESDLANSLVKIHVGFYDWLISSAPVLAMIPLALAVAVAVAVIQIIRKGADREMWGASAAFAVCALVLAASVAIRPSSAAEVSGPLARELKPRELDQASGVDVGYGPGLIIAVIALVVVCGIAAWQYIATSKAASA